MSRFLHALLAVFLLPVCVVAQTTIVQWNFNSNPPDASNATGSTSPSTGTGTIFAAGGTTILFGSGNAGTGSSDPTVTDDTGYQVTDFPSSGADKTAGIEFRVSTAGYTQIIVQWDQRHSNTSSANLILQYSIDGGTNWVDSDTYAANAGDTWFNGRSKDFSAVTALNNNADVRFRIVSLLSGGNYVASNPAGTYATTGNWRFDMLTVSGTAISLPVSLVSFNGKAVGETVSLEWKTVTEKGNSHFVVERSSDARSFEAIARVAGHGTTSAFQVYQYTDRQPETGINYYRLRQVDADGGMELLRMISVETTGAFDPYPNPATEQVKVKGGHVRSLALLSLQGQVVARSDRGEIGMRHLPAGAYILHTYLETGEYISRLVVKK